LALQIITDSSTASDVTRLTIGSGTDNAAASWDETTTTYNNSPIVIASGSNITTSGTGTVGTALNPLNPVYAQEADSGCTATPIGRNTILRAWNSTCAASFTATLQGGAAGVGNFALSSGGFTAAASSTSSFNVTNHSGTINTSVGTLTSSVAAGGTAWLFNTTNTINSSGTLFGIYNNGARKTFFVNDGSMQFETARGPGIGTLAKPGAYFYFTGTSNGDNAFEMWGTNLAGTEVQRVNLTSHVNTAAWTFMDTNVTAGSGATITATGVTANSVALTTDTTGNYVAAVADGTGVDGTCSSEGCTYTPTLDLTEITPTTTWGAGAFTAMKFDAGATDPQVNVSSGSIGLDQDGDGNANITANASGVNLNPSDDGSSEWSQDTLGAVIESHAPALSGGTSYQVNQALSSGNASGAITGFAFVPATTGAGFNGVCVGGSAAGAACVAHATCTGGGACRANANSGDYLGLNFAMSGIKGVYDTIYPLNVDLNLSGSAFVYAGNARGMNLSASFNNTMQFDRVDGLYFDINDTAAAGAITGNGIAAVNFPTGSIGYGFGSAPITGLRMDTQSAASTNVAGFRVAQGGSIVNSSYLWWGAALDTTVGSRSGGVRMNGTSTLDLEIGTTVRGQVTTTGLKSNGQGVASGTGSNSHGVVLFGVKTVTDGNFDTGTEVCAGNSPALTCVGTSDVLGTNIACGTAHTAIDNWLAFCK